MSSIRSSALTLFLLTTAMCIAGCATPAAPTSVNAVARPTPGTPQPPGAAVSPAPTARPFADVIKDAKPLPGFFTLWQKDEKVWIEVKPEQFDQLFFMSINISRGLGERGLFAGLMGSDYSAGGAYLVELRKIHNTLQLIARNTQFMARDGSPEARAVKNGFSDSLLSAAPIASQPHPERKSVLIEANALLLADIPRGATALERAYRNGFGFDRGNSYFADLKSNAERTTVDITAHYAQARVPLPPPPSPFGGPPAPYFPPPAVIEDPRSLFLGFLYTFTKLPDQVMRPRLADNRIGHFVSSRVDFSDETRASPLRHYVQRWRLEKKDPSAAMSEPVKPIVYWLDREIPLRYRAPISAGILEWNKAFEAIGYKDAIQVRVQADDADFDTGDALHASVRWFTSAVPSFGAIGPTHVDPRSGEIIDADIGWDANQTRAVRAFRTEVIGGYQPMYDERSGAVRQEAVGQAEQRYRVCDYFQQAIQEMGFAMALLEARGSFDPDGPDVDRFVDEFLKDVTMHEVGHTLGLRHNFRASTVYSEAQLNDTAFTTKNGLMGSVMEYAPINLSARGERQGQYFTSTLGAYDYWAIAYAYTPMSAAEEPTALAAIASRSNEPQLAFATDGAVAEGLDPEVNQNDLGNDPLAYFKKRVELSHELWRQLEQRELKPGESYNVLRRRFMTGFNQLSLAMGLAAKYIAGATSLADYAGSNRLPFTPTPVARQREALSLLANALFKADSFQVTPSLLRKLAIDRLDAEAGASPQTTDLSLPDLVLNVQRDVLNRLMGPVVAQRLLSNGTKVARPDQALPLSELYGSLQASIWAEAQRGGNADVLRRNLQREHLRRVSAALTGQTALPADARSTLRDNARVLRDWLHAAANKPIDAVTRSHYREAYETIDEALKAQIVRNLN